MRNRIPDNDHVFHLSSSEFFDLWHIFVFKFGDISRSKPKLTAFQRLDNVLCVIATPIFFNRISNNLSINCDDDVLWRFQRRLS